MILITLFPLLNCLAIWCVCLCVCVCVCLCVCLCVCVRERETPYKFQDYLFQFREKYHGYFGEGCIKSVMIQGSTIMLCCPQSLSCVRIFAVPWTAALRAPLSKGILQAKYWSALPCPPPGDLPYPGVKPRSSTLQADSLLLSHI